MNIQEYISSGIVENYVLGLTDEKETAEFERMCEEYSEVKEAREAFEISLEEQAKKNVNIPPPHLKSKIFAEIDVESDRRPQPVIPLTQPDYIENVAKKIKWLRYMNAASIIFLIASTAFNFYFYSSLKELRRTQNTLLAKNNVIETRLKWYDSTFVVIKDPDMAVIQMPAVPKSPDPNSFATVYWGKKTQKVYLLVKDMPEVPSDKQFQLWALVNGKPVDAGVFDFDREFPMKRLKNIPYADGFAITLEKRGGSATPSMDQMYVRGDMPKVEG